MIGVHGVRMPRQLSEVAQYMNDKAKAPDQVDVLVGTRIRLLRKERGIAQDQLAKAIGVSFQQVQKYENAKNRVSISMLSRIARTLETTVGDLIGEQDDGHRAFEDIEGLMSQPGAIELLRAYASLPRGSQRRAVVDLVATMSGKIEQRRM